MKGFRKRAAAVALGVCMAAGAALGLSACDWVADDPAVSNPSDSGGGTLFDPEDPVTEPEEPSAGGTETEDPEQGGTETEEPTTQPEEPEQGGETETEDPEQGGTETEDPEQGGSETEDPEQGGTTEPEEPAPSGSSLDEIMAAYDTIYGYQVTADGRDFVRDESGDPITVFKHEELYETVQNFLNSEVSSSSTTTYTSYFYGKFSTVERLLANYNSEENIYTIITLCGYANPETENVRCLNILEIPMDLSSNSFLALEDQLKDVKPKNMNSINYDYKLSNIEYDTEEYFTINVEQDDKAFLDKCVDLAYLGEEQPQKALILFKAHDGQGAGFNIGNHTLIEMYIVSVVNNTVVIDNRQVRSSAVIGDGWVRNVMNYETDIENGHTYVVIFQNESQELANLDKVFYNENLIEEIIAA